MYINNTSVTYKPLLEKTYFILLNKLALLVNFLIILFLTEILNFCTA